MASQDPGEHSLVVAIEKAADTSETCDTEHSKISEDGCGTRAAGELETMVVCGICDECRLLVGAPGRELPDL